MEKVLSFILETTALVPMLNWIYNFLSLVFLKNKDREENHLLYSPPWLTDVINHLVSQARALMSQDSVLSLQAHSMISQVAFSLRARPFTLEMRALAMALTPQTHCSDLLTYHSPFSSQLESSKASHVIKSNPTKHNYTKNFKPLPMACLPTDTTYKLCAHTFSQILDLKNM